jgi:uncharacterized protein
MDLRDKDYIITKDNLIFNVIGYEHPPDRTTANLKYVDGKKWNSGYAESLAFLRGRYPHYVHGHFASVPDSGIKRVFKPREGLKRLLEVENPNEAQQKGAELVRVLSEFFGISLDDWGVTDSLLWGPGRPGSDVDLVVIGEESALIVQEKLPGMFELPNLERFPPETFEKPPGLSAKDFEKICARKLNFGFFKGVRFSLRAVRTKIPKPCDYKPAGLVQADAEVLDASESLFFPAVYGIDSDVAGLLVSFSNSYENVFRRGDRIQVSGELEKSAGDTRIVVGTIKNSGKEFITY